MRIHPCSVSSTLFSWRWLIALKFLSELVCRWRMMIGSAVIHFPKNLSWWNNAPAILVILIDFNLPIMVCQKKAKRRHMKPIGFILGAVFSICDLWPCFSFQPFIVSRTFRLNWAISRLTEIQTRALWFSEPTYHSCVCGQNSETSSTNTRLHPPRIKRTWNPTQTFKISG